MPSTVAKDPIRPARPPRRALRRAAAAALAVGTAAGALAPAALASPPQTGSPGFPVTISTPAGPLHLAHRPQRIVSLSPSATEDLYAIGAGREVVAVDNDSDFPKGAPRTQLSGFTPNAEAIAGYRPDLVVISYDTGLVKTLGELAIPVLYQPAPGTLAGAYAEIGQLGAATGDRAGAARVLGAMRAQIGRLLEKAPRFATPPSYYYELDPTFYSVTSSTFVG